MGFQFDRLLKTTLGRIVTSILLGLGLAALFKKSCSGQSCITYHGPILGQIEDKTYQYGDNCYMYTISPIQCQNQKKTVEISNEIDDPTANLAAPKPLQYSSWFIWGKKVESGNAVVK